MSTTASLLLWLLLPAVTLSADVSRCPNRSKIGMDREMVNYTGPVIDTETCDQRPVITRPNGVWKLTSTKRNPLQFVFTPHEDFEYFEVLFSRGRSRSYNSLQVNKSLVGDGPYSVSITFRTEPETSTAPEIICDIFINSKNDPDEANSRVGGETEDYSTFLAGIKEISCSSELAPNRQTLSNIVILVVGGSEWLFEPDWILCPDPASNNGFNHENTRETPDDESNNRSAPGNPVISTTTSTPNYNFSSTSPTGHTWTDSVTDDTNPRIRPRMPEHDYYGRNRTSLSPVVPHHDDRVHEEGQEQPPSNTTDGHELKESGIVGDAIIASSIVGVLAVLLLAIGCCFLFRHLNLKGTYGIHGNTYEPQSSLHLRDSQFDDGKDVGTTNPGHTATDAASSPASKPAVSQQTSTIAGGGGAGNQLMSDPEGTPC